MDTTLHNAVNDIKRVNSIEPKGLLFKIIKTNEEFGELCAEIVKLKGSSYKPFNKENLTSEMADVLQCIFAVFFDIEKETDISIIDDVIPMVFEKNKKWEAKIKEYNGNPETPPVIAPEVKPSRRVNINDVMGRFNRGVMPQEVSFQINSAIAKYGKHTLSWGGPESTIKFASQGHTPDDIVLFERGVKGPADWFYYDNKGLFRHGGYTGYKEGITAQRFLDIIAQTFKQNAKWGMDDGDDVQEDPAIKFIQLTSKLIAIEVPFDTKNVDWDCDKNTITYQYPVTYDVKIGESSFTTATQWVTQTLKLNLNDIQIWQCYPTVNQLLKNRRYDLTDFATAFGIHNSYSNFAQFFKDRLPNSINPLGIDCPHPVSHLSNGNWKDGFSGTSNNNSQIEEWCKADKTRTEYLLVLLK